MTNDTPCTPHCVPEFTKALLKALGLDNMPVSAIDLRFATGEIIAAKVEMAIYSDHVGDLARIFKEYELSPRPKDREKEEIEITTLVDQWKTFKPNNQRYRDAE